MAGSSAPETFPTPTLLSLGDSGIVVRFGTALTDAANRAAIAFTLALADDPIVGVVEVVPNLVSVLLRYDPMSASPTAIAGEARLRLYGLMATSPRTRDWIISVRFDGPDVDEVASTLGMMPAEFVQRHNAAPLRVLATGFAPGFVYCGLHDEALVVPRRAAVRPSVPAGSVLFAAGQTAIAATEMPTGWHVIGHTDFANFNPIVTPPTRLAAGERIRFEVLA